VQEWINGEPVEGKPRITLEREEDPTGDIRRTVDRARCVMKAICNYFNTGGTAEELQTIVGLMLPHDDAYKPTAGNVLRIIEQVHRTVYMAGEPGEVLRVAVGKSTQRIPLEEAIDEWKEGGVYDELPEALDVYIDEPEDDDDEEGDDVTDAF
jgi:hypothetical protein